MAVPSVKYMVSRGLEETKAELIRGLMVAFQSKYDSSLVNIQPIITMGKINEILDGTGVEKIEKGNNAKSPAIMYVNMGDTYDDTVMWVNKRFVYGNWGSIVERGNYENLNK